MSEHEIDEVLRGAERCLLVTGGSEGPGLTPGVFWSDGHALWLLSTEQKAERDVLRAEPECGVYVPPHQPGGSAVLVDGRARVYTADEPLALALHGPVISTALAALAATRAGTMLGSRRGLSPLPMVGGLATRVVTRVAVERTTLVDPPTVTSGVAPPLPTVVPADVRRTLAGRRAVVAAVQDDRLRFGPGIWSTGYAFETVPDVLGPSRRRAALCVDSDETDRLAGPVTLTLQGQAAEGRLEPLRATWWRGGVTGRAEVTPEAPGGVELPD